MELGDIVYVREFIARGIRQHNIEFFFMTKSFNGTPTMKKVLAADNIRDVRFIAWQEMARMTVYPEVLKDAFWDYLKRGFPEEVYLGVQISGGELVEPDRA